MKDTRVFDDKNFSDLLREIHEATLLKRSRIDEMIIELRRLIAKPDDAVVLAPIIKEFLDVMVRNDEHLVKIAVIVQRMISTESKAGSGGIEDLLSDDEKAKLMADALKELEEEVNAIDANKIPTVDPTTILPSSGSLP
jgi:hypothetical protein